MNNRYRASQNIDQRFDDGIRYQPRGPRLITIPAPEPERKTWLRIAQFTALVAAALIVQGAMA